MKIINSILIIVLLISFACAVGTTGLMRFQDRELLIHPDKPGLGYPHNEVVCEDRRGIGRIFGKKKCKTVHVIDFYDLNDKSTRDKLRDGGFTCKSKMRFKY